MPHIFQKILPWIIKTCLYSTLFLPFIVTRSTLFPYVFGKAIFFEILIEIALFFWIILIALYPSYRPTVRAPISLALCAWFAALLASVVFGANPLQSFWGTHERMSGVFTLLHFAVFYFMLVSVMKTGRDWQWFLRAVVCVGTIVGAVMIYEGIRVWGERPALWFGNPGIAGSFMLFFAFLIPCGWAMERLSTKRTPPFPPLRKGRVRDLTPPLTKGRLGGVKSLTNGSPPYEGGVRGGGRFGVVLIIAFYTLAEIIAFAAIAISQTRAVWVGIAASLIVGGFFLVPRVYKFKRKKLYYTAITAVFIILFSIGAMVASGLLPASFYTKMPILSRARDVGVDQSRIIAWKAGLRAFKLRPLFGYGPENYGLAFNRYYNPEVSKLIAAYIGVRLSFDKAHNQFVEQLVDTGIIGFAAYIGLFAVVFWALIRTSPSPLLRKEGVVPLPLRRGGQGGVKITTTLALLFIAYLAQSAFSFDMPSSYLLLFLSFALAEFYARMDLNQNETALPQPKQRRAYIEVLGMIGIGLSFVFVPIVLYNGAIRPFLSSKDAGIASSDIAASKDFDVIFPFYRRAIEKDSVYAFAIAGAIGSGLIDSIKEYNPKNRDALVFIAKSLEQGSLYDWHRQTLLARIENLLCAEDKEHCSRALGFEKRAIELAPTRYQPYTEQYITNALLGEYKDARQSLERAFILGYEPGTTSLFISIGFMYAQLKEYENARLYYEKAAALEPENIDVLKSLVIVNAEMGNVKKAREQADEIIKKDPSLEGSLEEFLKR